MLEHRYPHEHKLLTAAVSAYVFLDENRNATKSLDPAWAKSMDGFYIMVRKNKILRMTVLIATFSFL